MPTDSARESLLRPSLGAEQSQRLPPYSNRAQFLSGFFGGPPAALALWGVNAYRLRRLKRDAIWLVLGTLAWISVSGLVSAHCTLALCQTLQEWQLSPRLVLRCLALLLVLPAITLYRKEQAASRLMGQKTPDGTWLALGLIAGGIVVQIALTMALP